jgi:hypothetical protein
MTIALDSTFTQASPRSRERSGSRWTLTVTAGVFLALAARHSPELQQVLIGLLIAAVTWVGALFLIGGIGFLTEGRDAVRRDPAAPRALKVDAPA